jgi:glycerophosphoryl diester phosphodiesterase
MSFLNLPYPAVIAHRGASLYAPENTLAAFQKAVEQGADAVELDAKLCSTGEVMVIHDQTVDRTTQGEGRVNHMSLAMLKELDAGSFFDVAFQGEKIPTLDEVFEAVGKKIMINVELTNYASPFDDLALKIAALVKRHNLIGQVFFSSFMPWTLARVHRIDPEVPICLLTLKGMGRGWLARIVSGMIHPSALQPQFTDVDHQFVEQAHQRGLFVNTWVVNNAEDMRRLIRDGVDGLISDDPLLALKVRSEMKNNIPPAN